MRHRTRWIGALLALMVATALLCLGLNALAQQMEFREWDTLRFVELVETPAGMAVEIEVDHLSLSETTPYRENYEAGRGWSCIIEILTGLAGMEEKVPEEVLANDPTGRRYEFFRSHCGLKWKFWLSLAKVGQAARELGDFTVLNADAVRLLDEMEAAFEPFLAPHEPPPELPSRKDYER